MIACGSSGDQGGVADASEQDGLASAQDGGAGNDGRGDVSDGSDSTNDGSSGGGSTNASDGSGHANDGGNASNGSTDANDGSARADGSGVSSDGGSCPPCGPCFGTSTNPIVDLAAATLPANVVVDANDVYWLEQGPGVFGMNGTIAKVPLNGGNRTVLAMSDHQPYGLAVDSTSIYWTTQTDGAVHSAALDGSNAVVLASQSGWFPQAIALDTSYVYWSWAGSSSGQGAIMRVAKTTGPSATLLSGVWPQGLAGDGSNVYWVTDPSSISNSLENTLDSVSVLGGTPAVLVKNLDRYSRGFVPVSSQVILDGSDVYFADNSGLQKFVALQGATLLASPPPSSFAMDATSVYGLFACEGVNTGWLNSWLATIPKTGGAWTTLVISGNSNVYSSIAVTDTTIYWTDGKSIKKMAK